MRKYITVLRSPHRYIIFTKCPDALIVNLNGSRAGKVIRIQYDASDIPQKLISFLRTSPVIRR